LYRKFIPIRQLAEEEPDKYDLGYCYLRYSTDEDGERSLKPFATFRSKQDFDLLWTLSVMTTAQNKSVEDPPNQVEITGDRDEHGWFINPTFKVTVGAETFSFSSHATTGAITTLTQLCELGQQHGLHLSEQDIIAAGKLLEKHGDDYAVESEVADENAASPAK
jgi:hypothetical protein